jgi:hypothetical protein
LQLDSARAGRSSSRSEIFPRSSRRKSNIFGKGNTISRSGSALENSMVQSKKIAELLAVAERGQSMTPRKDKLNNSNISAIAPTSSSEQVSVGCFDQWFHRK